MLRGTHFTFILFYIGRLKPTICWHEEHRIVTEYTRHWMEDGHGKPSSGRVILPHLSLISKHVTVTTVWISYKLTTVFTGDFNTLMLTPADFLSHDFSTPGQKFNKSRPLVSAYFWLSTHKTDYNTTSFRADLPNSISAWQQHSSLHGPRKAFKLRRQHMPCAMNINWWHHRLHKVKFHICGILPAIQMHTLADLRLDILCLLRMVQQFDKMASSRKQSKGVGKLSEDRTQAL